MATPESEDIRMEHIRITSQQVLDYDIGHWKELIWKEENQAIIKDFLDTPATTLLLVHFDKNEKLILSLELPSKHYIPKNVCFFLKSNLIISVDNYKEEITFGNISDLPLNQYHDLFGKVIAPIFCNSSNNSRWPDEIALDIANHFQDFQTTLSYHVGLAEEKTILLIPETAKLIENYEVNDMQECDNFDWELRKIFNSITEMLSNWIPIVREILELTPEHILSQVDQSPNSEVLFWNERKNNLENIYNQVNNPLIQKMVLALEKTNNCHFLNFRMLLQDIAEGLDEAREICENFKAMSYKLQELDTCTVQELLHILPDVMILITSSWFQSKYYRSVPSRVIVLMQKICCLLIEKVHQFLDPLNLFKRDRDETKTNVKLSLDMVNLLLKSYYECREQAEVEDDFTKPYPWEFPDERIFSQFEKFILRLDEVHEIFSAADVYFNIPYQKLINIHQTPYKKRLEDLQSRFAEVYKIFELSTYNALDLQCEAFVQDFLIFSEKLQELDPKLGIAIGQLISLFEEVVKRPLAQDEFRKLISSHVINIYAEFLNAKQNYSNFMTLLDKSKECFIYKNLPEISSSLQWSIDLEKQLISTTEPLSQVEHYFEDSDNYKYTLKTYQEMRDLLSKFEDHMLERWKSKLNKLDEKLNKVLFISIIESQLLLNFDSEVSEIAQEIRYLKLIKKDNLLPAEANNFNNVCQDILLSQSLLACSVRWYNNLSQSLVAFERELISEQWNEIDELMKQGYSKTWISDDLLSYAQQVYDLTKSVYEVVIETKKNVLKIEKFIESWKDIPIYVRETPNSLMDFKDVITPAVRKQVQYIKDTSRRMTDVLQKNLELFKSDPNSDEWQGYLYYLDSIIEKGLKDTIKCSLEYIFKNTDPQNKKIAPFYKVCMLLEQDITFRPPLDTREEGSLSSIFNSVLEQIYSLAKETKSLSKSDSDFYDTICRDIGLETIKLSIKKNVSDGINKTLAESKQFRKYSDLWSKDIDEVLTDFVLHGPMPDIEEDEFMEEVIQELKPPTEEEFKTEIAQFDQLQKRLDDIPLVIEIESWLILDVTFFKETILTLIQKWSTSYKKKLVELKSLGKLRVIEEDG
ncbi:dynein beta chain, ciliary [Trichonephila inaurata madagascariensis]|uniref:Dynein beta chain, ciliary n=1 Tax=Trichonephila inaurata madagascariensis TaxID=2747483 RepID=A0A8X6WNA7_9ARAC|nr:dynein beta chain, ciliary [Trichonephila inaurata madagascariensis]